MVHEERFPATRLSAGYEFRKETLAGTRRNGRDAPLPAVRGTAMGGISRRYFCGLAVGLASIADFSSNLPRTRRCG